MNVRNVGDPTSGAQTLQSSREFMLVRNLTNVSNVERLSFGLHTLLNMRKAVKGNFVNVRNVGRPFFVARSLTDIRKSILVKESRCKDCCHDS